MPTTSEILSASADRMKNVTVEVVSIRGTVCIKDDTGHFEDIFMQGDDAVCFISEVDRLYNETGDLSKGTIALALAEPYVECIWGG